MKRVLNSEQREPILGLQKMALHFHFDILTKPEFSVCIPLASENMGTYWDAMSLQHICFLNNFFTFSFWVEPVRVDMARPMTVLTKNVIGVIGVICD